MFTRSACYYDKIYSFKDYTRESHKLLKIIQANLCSGGHLLLDMACGTGKHLDELKKHFTCEGLDINPDMVEIAQLHHPDLVFHQQDMINFDLQRQYDVIICLFSAIGYVKTLENYYRTIRCMASHLIPGGILLIEPWFSQDSWHPGQTHAVFIDEPDLKLARINTSLPAIDGISILRCIIWLVIQKRLNILLKFMNWDCSTSRICLLDCVWLVWRLVMRLGG